MPYLRLYVGDALQKQWEISTDRVTIGRSDENDIILPSSGVSKQHAIIEKDGQSWNLIDNNSSNGVYVNGQRIKKHSLKYWEEIQIFNHLLKFMAVARLPGEQQGELFGDTQIRHDPTMEVDIAGLWDLQELRKEANVTYLEFETSSNKRTQFALDKVNTSIGKSPSCDISVNGWFTPMLAAAIQRRNDGYYLKPARRGKVKVNNQVITKPLKLRDDDEIQVRKKKLKFYNRPLSDSKRL